MTRIERAFATLLLLSDGRLVTAGALAERFEVSVRTIYRDVEMLSATGVPVYAERGVAGGYRLLEGYFLPPIVLARGELVALLLGLALMRGLKVPPFLADLENAERKLVAALPPHLRPLLSETRRLIGFERPASDAFHAEPENEAAAGDAAAAAEARAVEIFLDGALDRHRVRFVYRTPYRRAAEGMPIEADPLGLLWDRDRWYLIGRRRDGAGNLTAEGLRFWRADRASEVEASGLRAEPLPAFDVRRHLGRNWLARAMAEWLRTSPVRIRMARHQAERLATDWYFRFAAFADAGSGAVVMSYGEDDPAKVFALVRWLGPGAELLEPAEWRARLAEELTAMAAHHC